jgi:hypothetical protein
MESGIAWKMIGNESANSEAFSVLVQFEIPPTEEAVKN